MGFSFNYEFRPENKSVITNIANGSEAKLSDTGAYNFTIPNGGHISIKHGFDIADKHIPIYKRLLNILSTGFGGLFAQSHENRHERLSEINFILNDKVLLHEGPSSDAGLVWDAPPIGQNIWKIKEIIVSIKSDNYLDFASQLQMQIEFQKNKLTNEKDGLERARGELNVQDQGAEDNRRIGIENDDERFVLTTKLSQNQDGLNQVKAKLKALEQCESDLKVNNLFREYKPQPTKEKYEDWAELHVDKWTQNDLAKNLILGAQAWSNWSQIVSSELNVLDMLNLRNRPVIPTSSDQQAGNPLPLQALNIEIENSLDKERENLLSFEDLSKMSDSERGNLYKRGLADFLPLSPKAPNELREGEDLKPSGTTQPPSSSSLPGVTETDRAPVETENSTDTEPVNLLSFSDLSEMSDSERADLYKRELADLLRPLTP